MIVIYEQTMIVNASSEHNLVPWITEHMHPKDTRGTVLYNLHHVATWREGRDVAGKLRGRGILEAIQLHYKYLSHLTTLILRGVKAGFTIFCQAPSNKNYYGARA